MCKYLKFERKCVLQRADNLYNYLKIKDAFESLHSGHHAPINQECPFWGTGDMDKCPLYGE